MSEDTHESTIGPDPQDRTEGVAALMQSWACECGAINQAAARVCRVCGKKHAFDSNPSTEGGIKDRGPGPPPK